jgi:hypothetical protein
MNPQPHCSVCGAPAAIVRQSLFPIPASAAYCQRCHAEGLEPLTFVRAYLALTDQERAEHMLMTGGNQNLDQVVARSLAIAEPVPEQDNDLRH